MLYGVARASKKYEVPVMVGVSEGERDFWGVARIVALVKQFRSEGVRMYLNADHTHSLERIREAVEAGFDEVLFDAGKEHIEENIADTKHVVEFVHSYNYQNGTDVLVEGELGYIGSGSVLLDSAPKGAALKEEDFTTPQEASDFVSRTGVDMLAPAVGNLHGMFSHAPNPAINIPLVGSISKECGVPLVLHGGSGIQKSQIQEAIQEGITVVHISTELRVAWRKGLDLALLSHQKEIAPYKIFPDVEKSLQRIIEDHIHLCWGL